MSTFEVKQEQEIKIHFNDLAAAEKYFINGPFGEVFYEPFDIEELCRTLSMDFNNAPELFTSSRGSAYFYRFVEGFGEFRKSGDYYRLDKNYHEYCGDIAIWFENFEPGRTPTNCEIKLNRGALTVQRSHSVLPVATEFARHHGVQSKHSMSNPRTRDRWHKVDFSYDFTYTILAMSTIVNCVPFNIDVEITTIEATVKKNAKHSGAEKIGGDDDADSGDSAGGNSYEIRNNTKGILPASSRIVATPLTADSEIEIRLRESTGDGTPWSDTAKFSMKQFKGKTLYRTLTSGNSNVGNLTVKMSTLPVAPKQTEFWPGDRVSVGLPGEKGAGVKKNELGGKEYEVMSREYKDEWDNTIVILRCIDETENEEDDDGSEILLSGDDHLSQRTSIVSTSSMSSSSSRASAGARARRRDLRTGEPFWAVAFNHPSDQLFGFRNCWRFKPEHDLPVQEREWRPGPHLPAHRVAGDGRDLLVRLGALLRSILLLQARGDQGLGLGHGDQHRRGRGV